MNGIVSGIVARLPLDRRVGRVLFGLLFGLWLLIAPPPLTVTELVLIDAAVPHPEFFLNQLQPQQQGMVLPPDSDLSMVTRHLQPYAPLQALHLITHGAPGQLQLGQTVIDAAQLERNRPLLQQWQTLLAPGADLWLYGCEVGDQPQGQIWLSRLHQLTGADLAASTNLSGDLHQGGDWQFETTLGRLATPLPLTGSYAHLLRQITVRIPADQGPGSLRWALTQANASPEDDLIELQNLVEPIVLQSPLPPITSNLYLIGHGATISGNHQFRVLHIHDSDVVLRDLTIANGLVRGQDGIATAGGSAGLGGGLLIDGGGVTLSQVQMVNNRAEGGNGGIRSIPEAGAMGQIQLEKPRLKANRGALAGINGLSLPDTGGAEFGLNPSGISGDNAKMWANRGAIAGVNGIGVGGIGSIAFGGGGGFGGFGNAGNGGNGGNGGAEGGHGGNGGDGGDGGVGIFGGLGRWDDTGSIGTIAYGGGGGFGGFGNAGNGGNGGNAVTPVAQGGNGGNGGNGGFGGGGGGGGFGGQGGEASGKPGIPGRGGFGGGDGELGYGGGGAGLGGAIFLKAGRLILHRTRFDQNAAIAGLGAHPGQGKGGGIFVFPESAPGFDQEDSGLLRIISLGGAPQFHQNQAAEAANHPTDNTNLFGSLVVFGHR